jgi:hypothetical protein
MPADFEQLEVETLPQLSNQPKSYSWRLENWGCRHDVSYDFDRTSSTEMRVEFPTDYAPPVAALQHGAKQHGFRFRLLYCEPGNGFCGIATESARTEYELTFNGPPEDEGIPQELIDMFSLNELYDESLDDSA